MTAKYDRDGVTFLYPENWSLEEHPLQGLPRTVSVTSPVGAYWSATVYGDDEPLERLQEQYVETFRQEYDDVELDLTKIGVGTETLSVLDIQFHCLDFLVHSRLIARRVGKHHVLIAWQAEDRDFDELEPVFTAITFTAIQDPAAT